MTLAEEVSQQIEIRKEMFTTAEPGIRDFFGNLIYERSPKMTNEEIRNEINGATKKLRETTRMVNEALNHAAGRLDKADNESFETGHKIGYDKGLTDGWELIRKLQKLDLEERRIILDTTHPTIFGILETLTPQRVIKKIEEYEKKKAEEERKKQEEAEKIQIGDVVRIDIRRETGAGDRIDVRTGVLLHNDIERLWYIDPLGDINTVQYTENVRVRKTGKHVDILGVLKE